MSALGDTPRITGLAGEVRLENAQASDRLTVQAGNGIDKLTAIGNVGALIGLALGNELQDQLVGGSGNETLRGTGRRGHPARQRGQRRRAGRRRPGPRGVEPARRRHRHDRRRRGAGPHPRAVPWPPTTRSRSRRCSHTSASRPSWARVSDLTSLEVIDLGAATGADRITVNDLSGTDTTAVVVDLGPADLKVDDRDRRRHGGRGLHPGQGRASGTTFSGSPPRCSWAGAEPGDRLTINGGDGEDTIDAQQMTKDKLQPFLNGGAAKDILVGSSGQDEVTGGPGDDVILLARWPGHGPLAARRRQRHRRGRRREPTSCA